MGNAVAPLVLINSDVEDWEAWEDTGIHEALILARARLHGWGSETWPL